MSDDAFLMDEQLIGLRGTVGWSWDSSFGGRKISQSRPAEWSTLWNYRRRSTFGWTNGNSAFGRRREHVRSRWGGKQRVKGGWRSRRARWR